VAGGEGFEPTLKWRYHPQNLLFLRKKMRALSDTHVYF
jgi:hypothetical protein